MTTSELVSQLRRPIYVFNMASYSIGRTTEAQIRSAHTRRANASSEIHELVMKYARERL